MDENNNRYQNGAGGSNGQNTPNYPANDDNSRQYGQTNQENSWEKYYPPPSNNNNGENTPQTGDNSWEKYYPSPENNNGGQHYQPPVNNNQGQYYQGVGNNNQQQYYQPVGNGNPQQQYYQPPMNNQGMPQPPMPQPPKKKNKAGKVIGIILGIIVFIFVALFVIGLFVEDEETVDTSVAESQSQELQETEEQTEEKETAKEFELGTISGDTYSNNFAGLGLKLPDSQWAFLDNDSIYEMLESSSPQRDENGGVYLEAESETAYYDLMMINNTSGTNIQVLLSETNGMAGVITSEDLYLSNSSSDVGTDGTVSDPYDITIAGEKYRAVDIDYPSYGTKQTIAAKKIGNDFVCVIVTVYNELDSNSCSYYTDMFYKP